MNGGAMLVPSSVGFLLMSLPGLGLVRTSLCQRFGLLRYRESVNRRCDAQTVRDVRQSFVSWHLFMVTVSVGPG